MKITKFILTLLFITGLGVITSSAQQGVVSAGGEASGSGGTMSFSTGQTDFMFFSSETGSIQFGLQQVFFFEEDEIPIERELFTDDLAIGEDQCFDAYETIILAGGGDSFIVDANTGVDLIAGHSILMLPGTQVEHGGYMHARISTDGLFCDLDEPIVASINIDSPDGSTYQEPLFTPERENSDKTFFRVYPNPTTGDFTLELLNVKEASLLLENGKEASLLLENVKEASLLLIEIYTIQGNLVFSREMPFEQRHTLSLAKGQPGIYLIRVMQNNKIGTTRIIKQ